MKPLIITGTDTGIGKTVVSAMLTLTFDAVYWKPIQAGTDGGTDTLRVKQLTGLPAQHFRAERHVLRHPLSPHRAAEVDDLAISLDDLQMPDVPAGRHLIIEGAGGILVPINRALLQIKIFARWHAPVVLCARTSLGTINHSLLSLEALRQRGIDVLGVVFIGDAMPDSERTIVEFGATRRLGRLPVLAELNANTLNAAFAAHFNRRDFETADG